MLTKNATLDIDNKTLENLRHVYLFFYTRYCNPNT